MKGKAEQQARQAWHYLEEELFDKAIVLFREILSNDATYLKAIEGLGVALICKRESWGESIDPEIRPGSISLEELVQARPPQNPGGSITINDVSLNGSVFLSYLELEQEAARLLTQAFEDGSENLKVLEAICKSINVSAELKVKAGEKLLDLQPSSGWGNFIVGTQYVNKNKLEDATPYLYEAVEANKGNAMWRNELANALMNTSRANEALIQLQTAVEIDPYLASAWMNMGTLYWQEGHVEDSIAAFKQFLEVEPHSMDAAKIKEWLENQGYDI